jgi:6-phosphogluconolactonase (cycloisomerase 2 family)
MATLQIEIAAPQRFAIVTGSDNGISTLSVDTVAGKLLRGPLGVAGAGDDGAEKLALHPGGQFGYLPNATSNTLATLAIDPDTGRVEHKGSIPIAAGPHSAIVHSSGNWLLVTCRASGQVQVFALDPLTGAPTLSSQIASGTQPSDLVWAGNGSRLFVTHAGADADGLGSTLALFSFDSTTGVLSPVGSPFFLNGARPSALAFDPHDSYVYLALNQFDAVVPILVTMSGGYTPITPLRATGANPVDVAVEAHGNYVWTAAAGANEVRSFRVSVANHRLSLVDTVTAGVEPVSLQGDPLGERVFVAARGSSEMIVLDSGPNGSLDVESSIAMRSGRELDRLPGRRGGR